MIGEEIVGACEFWVRAKGASMKDAYHDAREEAGHQSGYGGYTGTIVETDGCVQEIAWPMTEKGADWLSGNEAHKKDKWGPAYAIPIAADKEFNFKTVKLTVTLPGVRQVKDTWAPAGEQPRVREVVTSEYDLADHARDRVAAEYGHQIHDVKVETKMKTKVVVDTPAGKSVTRYETNGKAYETRAKAVAAAKAQARPGTPIPIRAVRYWPEANTSKAAEVRAVTESAVATVTVTLALAKVTHPTVIGWQFFGVASS